MSVERHLQANKQKQTSVHYKTLLKLALVIGQSYI